MMTRLLFLLILLPSISTPFPEQGKWTFKIGNQNDTWAVYKSLFENSTVLVDVNCVGVADALNITITWVLRETKCWDEYSQLEYLSYTDKASVWSKYLNSPDAAPSIPDYPHARRISPDDPFTHRCDSSISLPQFDVISPESDRNASLVPAAPYTNLSHVRHERDPILTIPSDGIYLLIINIRPAGGVTFDFNAQVSVAMKSPHGYLSAADWPLLSFYGGMCVVYVVYGLAWLTFSFIRWKDILQIQLWIGSVIFLGMLEMAVFYAEYSSINSTGVSVSGAVLFAEVVSCAKRTLARLLIVVVSIGFGIVKPRLGTTLHKLIVVGGMYFILATMESSLRVLHPVNGPSSRVLIAEIGLSLMDGFICYWIFQSLLSTTRNLRLRRNLVKLGLYRNFTNTLIFAVIASVGFMLWSIHAIKTPVCLENWKNIWIDEAFWHVQFSLILLVIMILWRPTNNNQRYAFSPLVDDLDDEEEDLVINEAFAAGMKLRPKQVITEKSKKYRNQTVDEDLKWVDANLPNDFGEGDLPAMDSEEEIITSKFELSKMQ